MHRVHTYVVPYELRQHVCAEHVLPNIHACMHTCIFGRTCSPKYTCMHAYMHIWENMFCIHMLSELTWYNVCMCTRNLNHLWRYVYAEHVLPNIHLCMHICHMSSHTLRAIPIQIPNRKLKQTSLSGMFGRISFIPNHFNRNRSRNRVVPVTFEFVTILTFVTQTWPNLFC